MPIYADKKTGRLFIEFQYKGTRYKERLPDGTTKKDAERLEVKIKNDLMFQSHGVQSASPITFDRFLREHFSLYAESNYCKDTFDQAVRIAKAALPYFRGKSLRQIKAADIERFKQSRIDKPTQHGHARKPATVEREMSIISRMFTIALRNDLIDYNPCSRVEHLKFDNIQNRVLTVEEERLLIPALPTQWAKDVCLMVLNTGLRRNDLMRLTRFQIDRNTRYIHIVQGKTKRANTIYLNDTAFEIINRRWSRSTSYLFSSQRRPESDRGSIRHTLRRTCEKLKIEVVTMRDLRRTYATRALERGNDSLAVADSLGHSSLRMIPRYVRSQEMKQKLAESIDEYANPPLTPISNNVKLLKTKG
jgi:integrase